MYLHADEKIAQYFKVFDKKTLKEMNRVKWVNTTTKELAYYKKDKEGNTLLNNLIIEKSDFILAYAPLN